MLDRMDVPPCSEARMSHLGNNSSVRTMTPSLRHGVTRVPPKADTNRPQQLLELAGQVTRAAWGGIALLAEGELAEHLTFGISDSSARALARTPWFVPFIRSIQAHPRPAALKDLAESFLGNGSWCVERGKDSEAGTADARACSDRLPAVESGGQQEGGHYKPGHAVSVGCGLPALGAVLGVSLNCPGLYQGALYLMRNPDQPAFDAVDEATVLSIRSWFEQWRLFDETHLLTRMRLLNQVAQAAAGSLDLEEIFALALRELDRHLPLQIGAVWIIDEAEQKACQSRGDVAGSCEPDVAARSQPRTGSPALCQQAVPFDVSAASLTLIASSAVFGVDSQTLGLEAGLRLRIDETPFATCLSDRQAVYADLRRPVGRNNRLAEDLANGGATSFFAVPLRAGDRTVGVLQSVCTRPSGFTNEQIQLLYLVADLLGPAISNCRLFDCLSNAYEELRMTQSHLIQAEKMRALGELAAGMAHDFNNSLCAVLGFLELSLLDKDLPATCRRYLESSRTCALDAAQTVHRVQDFARWRRKEMTVELVDPNVLVRQTLELSRHKWDRLALAGKATITVEQYTEATARVSGSSAELREVLTNFVFNAVDAMPNGGTLVVKTWNTDRDVFLSVQDTGVGINEQVRRRLFEPFFTTKGERGNGMGLSVSFGIIQRHNGEITVESVPNCGSTFTVRLPAAPEPAEEEKTAPVEALPGAACGSLRVLIVEDEESIRRFLAAGLTQLGHRPRLTADAHEALAAFAEEPFDVVLTDLGLPGVSGEDVARQIAERAPHVPVVLLTGWADQIKADQKPVAGVRLILGKPITLSTLANTLTTLCRS